MSLELALGIVWSESRSLCYTEAELPVILAPLPQVEKPWVITARLITQLDLWFFFSSVSCRPTHARFVQIEAMRTCTVQRAGIHLKESLSGSHFLHHPMQVINNSCCTLWLAFLRTSTSTECCCVTLPDTSDTAAAEMSNPLRKAKGPPSLLHHFKGLETQLAPTQ